MEPSIIMKLLIVHHVTNNVIYVKLIQTIVLPVLMVMLIHQNVQLLQLKPLQPKFTIFQSVLLKSLTVLVLVKPVNNILTTVLFVMLTELIHQPVCVLTVSILIPITNVKSVTTDVSLVTQFLITTLQAVLFVLIPELMLHIVVVQLVLLMMDLLSIVNLVTITVMNVTLKDVLLVTLTESIHQLVSVNQVCMN